MNVMKAEKYDIHVPTARTISKLRFHTLIDKVPTRMLAHRCPSSISHGH